MDFIIIERPSFSVIGTQIRASLVDGANMREIPKFWDSVMADRSFFEIEKAATGGPVLGKKSIGGCFDFDNEKQEFIYFIGFETSIDFSTEFVHRKVLANQWAVFTSVGPVSDALQNLWQEVMGSFFQTSEWQHAPNSPELEVYSVR